MSIPIQLPITAAQQAAGNLTSEGATNIALLQDLNRTVTPKFMWAQLANATDDRQDFCGLLASALTDDATFAQLYPDALLRDPNAIISGHGLPGLRQDTTGQWNHIEPSNATAQDRRDYVRRHLIVNAAKQILTMMNRRITNDHVAAAQPHTLHAALCLTQVAADVCKHFDPTFLDSISSPSLKSFMATANA